MSRLIDADAFEKFIKEKYKDGESTDDIKDQVLFDLSYQPTAYDPEAVVAELEKQKSKYQDLADSSNFDGWSQEEKIYLAKENMCEEIIEIVNQLAEEYSVTGGWIPCSERLPEVSGEYYTYVYYDGHYMYSVDEIDCDGMVKKWNCVSDYKVVAWKPIEPYQPKG